jgi:pyruvate,water dikinase
VCALARTVVVIEDHYSKIHQRWCPMDVEWAYDGVEKKMYIVQARPETVFSQHKKATMTRFSVSVASDAKPILTGQSIGSKAVIGRVRLVQTVKNNVVLQEGEILVTKMTDPDFLPLIKKAAGVITQQGGRTCHAAIVSRELGLPAIVGVANALSELRDGEIVTIDCTTGMVGKIYRGEQKIMQEEIALEKKSESPVPIMLNTADPDQAFSLALLPTSGVGLARIEFIIANRIGIHPRACIEYEAIPKLVRTKVEERIEIAGQKPTNFFVDTLARSIAQIAASFHPRPVFVRLSDFKSNEYRNLLGGELFEPIESNPMLGLRGASRYCHPDYQKAFFLECEAVEYAFTKMGCDNIHLLIPFVRTVVEATEVIVLLKSHIPSVAQKKMPICMMVELPSNIFAFEQFAPLFDSFSIGSNDLLQFTFGVDRDSAFFAEKITEQDPVFLSILQELLSRAKKAGKKIGICGQAPSDFPLVAEFLIKNGISYLSLNPDSVFSFFTRK